MLRSRVAQETASEKGIASRNLYPRSYPPSLKLVSSRRRCFLRTQDPHSSLAEDSICERICPP